MARVTGDLEDLVLGRPALLEVAEPLEARGDRDELLDLAVELGAQLLKRLVRVGVRVGVRVRVRVRLGCRVILERLGVG